MDKRKVKHDGREWKREYYTYPRNNKIYGKKVRTQSRLKDCAILRKNAPLGFKAEIDILNSQQFRKMILLTEEMKFLKLRLKDKCGRCRGDQWVLIMLDIP